MLSKVKSHRMTWQEHFPVGVFKCFRETETLETANFTSLYCNDAHI